MENLRLTRESSGTHPLGRGEVALKVRERVRRHDEVLRLQDG